MELPQDISSLTSLVYQLLARIEKLEAENTALRKENAELRQENGELKARLAQNSRNSHKPASLEGYQKKPALPKTGPKKQGGQKGHKGNTLQMVLLADQVVACKPQVCICGADLATASGEVVASRQVFDLPEPGVYRELCQGKSESSYRSSGLAAFFKPPVTRGSPVGGV